MITKIRQQNGITILEPNGKMMGPSVSELRTALSPQLDVAEAPRILINFENVNKIDSDRTGCTHGDPCRYSAKERSYRGCECE